MVQNSNLNVQNLNCHKLEEILHFETHAPCPSISCIFYVAIVSYSIHIPFLLPANGFVWKSAPTSVNHPFPHEKCAITWGSFFVGPLTPDKNDPWDQWDPHEIRHHQKTPRNPMCSKPGKARHWALLLGFQQAHQQQGTVAVSCDPWQQVQGPKRCTAGDFHMELSNRNRPEMMGSDGLMGVLLMGVLHMKSRLMTWWCGLWLMIFVRGKKCFVWKQKTFGVKPSLGNWDYKGRTSLRTVPGTPTCFHKIWNTNLLTLSKCSVPRNQESVKISSSNIFTRQQTQPWDTAGFTQGWDPWLHQRWGGAILADKPRDGTHRCGCHLCVRPPTGISRDSSGGFDSKQSQNLTVDCHVSMMWGVEVSDRWSCFSAGCPVSVVCVPWGEKALMLICMQRFEVIIGRWSDIVKHSHAFLFHACSMILWWSQSCKASWSRVGYLGIFGWIFSTKPWISLCTTLPLSPSLDFFVALLGSGGSGVIPSSSSTDEEVLVLESQRFSPRIPGSIFPWFVSHKLKCPTHMIAVKKKVPWIK